MAVRIRFQDSRTTLPYGGITRIRFGGSFSPRRTYVYVLHGDP